MFNFIDVDPRRFVNQQIYPMPPPQYNQDMMGNLNNRPESNSASSEPPAYTAISETTPIAPKSTALKSESSGTIVSVRSRHDSGGTRKTSEKVQAAAAADLATTVETSATDADDDNVAEISDTVEDSAQRNECANCENDKNFVEIKLPDTEIEQNEKIDETK